MSGARSPQQNDYRAFVDALRECLGLEPLFSKSSDRYATDLERFGGRSWAPDLVGRAGRRVTL